MLIRKVRKEDIWAFTDVYQKAYAEIPEYAYTRRKDIRNYFRWLLNRDAEGFMVAEVDDVAVGFVATDTNWISYVTGERVGEIHELFVLPEYRRRGIGSSLLTRSLKYAEKRGHKIAELWVGERNENAKRFYRKFGFREEGKWGKWVRMVREL